jgi:transcriptional regulator with XRE-family HTH domain
MTNTFIPEHGKRTTLRDVAREAGVSIKTVSRVVNDEPLVNEATAARVADAVKRLGYRPNELARSLKGQRSHTIGLVIDDVSNPFMAICAQAIEAVAREHGHALVLCDSHADLRQESDYVGLLTQRQVDGLLIVPARGHDSHLEAEQAAGLPVVPSTGPRRASAPTRCWSRTARARGRRRNTSSTTATSASPSSVTSATSIPPANASKATKKRWRPRACNPSTPWTPIPSGRARRRRKASWTHQTRPRPSSPPTS